MSPKPCSRASEGLDTGRVFRSANVPFVSPVNLPSKEEVKYDEFLTEDGNIFKFRQSPDYTFETKISEKGSEADAETAETLDFIVNGPSYVIIATTNHTPLKVFVGRLNALG
ncbi:uncharacterized protein [Venturia canescens]|uniref:uncharacterized protein n=1 Tax=Venturia canescens TaxID=32260 RepID=UPI001C9C5A64|nr:uncharacterized protein LOC122410536 [Venturia canescens]